MSDDEIYNLAMLMVVRDVLKKIAPQAPSPERHREEIEKTTTTINDYLSQCNEVQKQKVMEYYVIERAKTFNSDPDSETPNAGAVN